MDQVYRSRTSQQNRHHTMGKTNRQKDKQCSTKYYIEHTILSNMTPTTDYLSTYEPMNPGTV